jgi:hypothetical protein
VKSNLSTSTSKVKIHFSVVAFTTSSTVSILSKSKSTTEISQVVEGTPFSLNDKSWSLTLLSLIYATVFNAALININKTLPLFSIFSGSVFEIMFLEYKASI